MTRQKQASASPRESKPRRWKSTVCQRSSWRGSRAAFSASSSCSRRFCASALRAAAAWLGKGVISMLSLMVGASACAILLRAVWALRLRLPVGLVPLTAARLPLVRCDLVLEATLPGGWWGPEAAGGLSGASDGPSAALADGDQGDAAGPRLSVSEIANNGATPSGRPMPAAYPFAARAAKPRFRTAARGDARLVVPHWAPSVPGV